MKRHVVIIGAGVIGASIAYHLSRLGMRVTVLDAEGPAAGASGASDSAVSIATKSPGHVMELAIHSKAYYSELARPSGPLQNAYHERSTFLVAENDAEIEVLMTRAACLKQSGVSVRELEGSALRATLPELRQGIPLVLEVLNEGHARGYQVVDSFLNACEVEIRRNTPVNRIEFAADSSRCIGISSNGSLISADDVIVAAGTGSGHLLNGINIQPQCGQLIITDRSDLPGSFPGTLCFANYLVAKSRQVKTEESQDTSTSGRSLVINPSVLANFLLAAPV